MTSLDLFEQLILLLLHQVHSAQYIWVRHRCRMAEPKCLHWNTWPPLAIQHALLLSFSVLLLQGECFGVTESPGSYFWSLYTLPYITWLSGPVFGYTSTFFSFNKEPKHHHTNILKWIPTHCTLFLFAWQRQRKCDRGDILLQEGGPCSDCYALHGTSSYCGMHMPTYHFLWSRYKMFHYRNQRNRFYARIVITPASVAP